MKTRPTLAASTAHSTAAAILMRAVLFTSLLAGCASGPKVPDWQMESKAAVDRSVAAYLEGNGRVEIAERARARKSLASTGRADLLAAAELLHCAARVSSLVFEPCNGFELLRQDATDSQRAYADYLGGKITTSQIALLPAPQRGAANRLAQDESALQGMDEPLSLLVAAAVLMKTGKANPAIIAQAVDTATHQGWRRPLLAWLGVQAQRAKLAGQTEEENRIQRRIALVLGEAPASK